MLSQYYGGVGVEFIGHGMMKIPYDQDAPLNSRNLFWMPSWAGAEVKVDEETGRVHVMKLVVGADSGHSVNPVACRGQVEGAALQAYSQAMFEQLSYEGANPVNAIPQLYRVAAAGDLPDVFESFVEEQGYGPGTHRLKGIGESRMLVVA